MTNISKYFSDPTLTGKFDGRHVVFIGYVGEHNGVDVFDYGLSIDITKTSNEHRKQFESFQMIHVVKCDNNVVVKNLFGDELENRNLMYRSKINRVSYNDLFTVNNNFSCMDAITLMNQLVVKNVLPAIKLANDMIKQANDENEELRKTIRIYEALMKNSRNGINNSHKLVPFTEESIDHLSKEQKLEILKDFDPLGMIIYKMSFNSKAPHNYNFYYEDPKSEYGMIFNGIKWKNEYIEDLLHKLIESAYAQLCIIYDEFPYLPEEERNTIENKLDDIQKIIRSDLRNKSEKERYYSLINHYKHVLTRNSEYGKDTHDLYVPQQFH